MAFKEAQKYCKVNEVSNNKENNCTSIAAPETWNVDPNAAFFHYCDNETIQGVEINDFPFHLVPEGQTLVCDMSSNFCSRPIDWSKFGVVYAGAQKNVGPAGVCISVIRKDLIGK
jgi:phosphoserine aminotransferase